MHPILCNRNVDCNQTWSYGNDLCYNTASEEDCISMGKFFCNMSKTCIPLDKKCDGIVHCIEGEDETFETCKHLNPEEATIDCNERPKGRYDIKDMAIPCNDIPECADRKDENCDKNTWILVGVVLVLVISTNVIYHYLKWYKLNWNRQHISPSSIIDDWSSIDCTNMMGDELANMKVRFHLGK